MTSQNNVEMNFFEEQLLIECLKQQFNYLLKPLDATIHYSDEGELLNYPGYEKRVVQISLSPSSKGIQPQLWDVDLEVVEMEGTRFDIEIEVFINSIIELIREHSKLDIIGYLLEAKNIITLFITENFLVNSPVYSEFDPIDWRKQLSKSYPGLKVFPKKE